MLRNSDVAELLAREAEQASGHLSRAFRSAARAAFLWPVEAGELLAQGKPLRELAAIGPYLEKKVGAWIESGAAPPRPPEVRRDFLTMAKAKKLLARKPEWRGKLKADLQMHSTWSDGSGTIREMADAAIARQYQYIAITDHTKGLKIAGGIDEKRLREQEIEITGINKEFRARQVSFTVLRSAEVNLNPRGEVDMEAKALRRLDLVLGSFHSSLRSKEDQTDRYLAAIRNPLIHILGHPRGRVFNYRLGLKADWSRVFAEAARLGKAVEIDSYPDRQDLNVGLLRLAGAAGTRISIGTDAHHPWQLEFIELGLAAAAMAGIKSERIINFLSMSALKKWAENCLAS